MDHPTRDHVESHYDIGRALKRREEWTDAARWYRGAVELDPTSVLSHHGLGQVLKAHQPLAHRKIRYPTPV